MRWVKFFSSLLVTIALSWALLTPFAPLPVPLGELFDPHHGFWVNATFAEDSLATQLTLPELDAPVEVVIDERGVPHIFAQNDHDLYFAQGYLTARDRLWQMDFQIRAAVGELSEILGAGPDSVLIKRDRSRRRIGMRYGAERKLQRMDQNDTTRLAVEAYTQGINAYLASLAPHQYPIEYKILGYEPRPWQPLYTGILTMVFADDLAGSVDDLSNTLALSFFGKEITERLYPDYPYAQAPIVPADTRWPRTRELPVAPLVAPDDYSPDSLFVPGDLLSGERPPVGSNNWAVSGSRTTSGKPILANDPHLGLNLPAIWYEIQLHAPGVNTYGVSLPGAPCVIIGFNDSVAWGITSAGQDVKDYYTVRYRNERRLEYYYDGQWMPVRQRIDSIKVKGLPPLIDTIRFTLQGPILYEDDYGPYEQPIAMQWMAHEPSNELMTYYHLNRAANYQDYQQAIRYQSCPALNIAFAAADGDIAIWHAGRLPLRWQGQGKYLLDGSKRTHGWNGDIPWNMLPHLYNPERGYVQSANQHPTAPDYPYAYPSDFEAYRNRRLDTLLGGTDTFSVGDLAPMQLDSYAQFAADILPLMLAELDSTSWQANEKARMAYDSLKRWRYTYHREQAAPTLYDSWWTYLSRHIWQDDLLAAGAKLRYPSRNTTIGLLLDSAECSFYRIQGDAVPYTRADMITRSFDSMLMQLPDDLAQWAWRDNRLTDIRHIARLGPFSRTGLMTDGQKGTLNATSRVNGPSWRMVVEMTSPPTAMGIYPGGQSGRPASSHYDDFIEDWREGEYYPLWLMQSPDDPRVPRKQHTHFQPN